MNKRMMYAILLTALLSLSACGVNTETSLSDVDVTDENSIVEVVLTDKNTSQPEHFIERSLVEDEVPLIEMVDQDVRGTSEFQMLNDIMQIADNDCITFEEETGVTKIIYTNGNLYEYVQYKDETESYTMLTVSTPDKRFVYDVDKKIYYQDTTIDFDVSPVVDRVREIYDMGADYGTMLKYIGREDDCAKFEVYSTTDESTESMNILLRIDGDKLLFYMNDEQVPYYAILNVPLTDSDKKLIEIEGYEEVSMSDFYGIDEQKTITIESE